MKLVFLEPSLWSSINYILEIFLGEAEQKSNDLSFSSDTPISNFNFSASGLEGSVGRNIRAMDGSRSLIIALDFLKLLEVMLDSPPEAEVFIFTWIESLEVREHFSQDEVDQGQITKGPFFISDEFLKIVEFRSGFLQNLNLNIFVIFIPVEASDVFQSIIDDSQEIINFSFIFRSSSQ